MDLKKNYERFFGKLPDTSKPKKNTLNENDRNKFDILSTMLGRKYPTVPLTIKENYVYIGLKKLEPFEDFIKRSSLNIQSLVKSKVR